VGALHANLRGALECWTGSPYVQTSKGEPYTPERFRAAWTRLMDKTPAGRIRKDGFTFHGLRASSCEKLAEVGCNDKEIESMTGMSQAMIRRYCRFATRSALRSLQLGG
jgi:integrase